MTEECWNARDALDAATTAHQNAKERVSVLLESRSDMRYQKGDWESKASERQYTVREKRATLDDAESKQRDAHQKQQHWQEEWQRRIRDGAPADQIDQAHAENRKWYDRNEKLREYTVPAARREHDAAKRSVEEAKTEVARLTQNLETLATTIENKKMQATAKREARDKAQRKVDKVC